MDSDCISDHSIMYCSGDKKFCIHFDIQRKPDDADKVDRLPAPINWLQESNPLLKDLPGDIVDIYQKQSRILLLDRLCVQWRDSGCYIIYQDDFVMLKHGDILSIRDYYIYIKYSVINESRLTPMIDNKNSSSLLQPNNLEDKSIDYALTDSCYLKCGVKSELKSKESTVNHLALGAHVDALCLASVPSDCFPKKHNASASSVLPMLSAFNPPIYKRSDIKAENKSNVGSKFYNKKPFQDISDVYINSPSEKKTYLAQILMLLTIH